MPTLPVKLADNVWRIPTLGANLINSFAFEEPDGSLTLVDAGLRGAPKKLVRSLAAIGKQPSDVTRILLTHAHVDHVGGAAPLRRQTGASVHIHDDDAEFLRSGHNPPQGTGRGPLGRVFALAAPRLPSCEVDGTFCEGDVLDVAGGLTVLHTPGHTPGHASFLHGPSGVLVTGDALFNFRDKMSYSFALFCFDAAMSRDTADRLGEVDYETVAFTHGPEIRHGARDAVRAFLAKRRA